MSSLFTPNYGLASSHIQQLMAERDDFLQASKSQAARIKELEEENRMLKAGFLEAQAALTRSEEELAQAEEQNAILAKNLADAFTELHRR